MTTPPPPQDQYCLVVFVFFFWPQIAPFEVKYFYFIANETNFVADCVHFYKQKRLSGSPQRNLEWVVHVARNMG